MQFYRGMWQLFSSLLLAVAFIAISAISASSATTLAHTAWFFGKASPTSPRDANVIVFLDETHYVFAKSTDGSSDPNCTINGIELGLYTWNPVDNSITANANYKTSGFDCGFDGIRATMVVNGNNAILTVPGEGDYFLDKISSATNPIVGAWGGIDPVTQDGRVAIFLDDSNYMYMKKEPTDECGQTGMEHGTYTWNQNTKVFTANAPVDTTGCWGVNGLVESDGNTLEISNNTLTVTDPIDPPPFYLPRITTYDSTDITIIVPDIDADGNYTVSWTASATTGVTYVLEEATDNNFSSGLRTVPTHGPSANIIGRRTGTTYYYRVKSTLSGTPDSDWTVGANGCVVSYSDTPPPFSVDTQHLGSVSNLTLTTRIYLDAPNFVQQAMSSSGYVSQMSSSGLYKIYVAAYAPDGLQIPIGFYFLNSNSNWAYYTGGTLPEYLSNINAAQTAYVDITILEGVDVSTLIGTQIYVGYGIDDQEMISATRYRAIYTIQE